MYIRIIMITLLLMPAVNAWNWDTHQNIIEYVYLNLPPEKQQQLNLTKLREGAVMPDRDFKDHKLHHYPKSLEEAKRWLNNDTDLSLSLGIASHYITDSFAAPHNVFGEKYSQHAQFENQVRYYYPNVDCEDYGYSIDDLGISTENSEDWDKWLKTKNNKIPQKEVDEAEKFLFSIILKKLDTKCDNMSTNYIEIPYITKNKLIIISLVLIIGLYFLKN